MAAKKNVLPMVEVARLCLAAGFTPWRSVIVTSVIQAESGGDALAVGLNDHDHTVPSYLSLDLGLAQFNTWYFCESPAQKNKIPIRDMFTPDAAIGHMYKVSEKGFRLEYWNAYKNGFHTKHIPAARIAVRAAGGVGV